MASLEERVRKLEAQAASLMQELEEVKTQAGATDVLLRGEGASGAVLDSPTIAKAKLLTGEFAFYTPPILGESTEVLPSTGGEAGIYFRNSLADPAQFDWSVGTTSVDGRFTIGLIDGTSDFHGLVLRADGGHLTTSSTGLKWTIGGVTYTVTPFYGSNNAGPPISSGSFNAKGDLLVGTANNELSALTVGANGTVLTADSTTATGLKWV